MVSQALPCVCRSRFILSQLETATTFFLYTFCPAWKTTDTYFIKVCFAGVNDYCKCTYKSQILFLFHCSVWLQTKPYFRKHKIGTEKLDRRFSSVGGLVISTGTYVCDLQTNFGICISGNKEKKEIFMCKFAALRSSFKPQQWMHFCRNE